MAKLKLDLHDVYNNGKAIDQALENIFNEAIDSTSNYWRTVSSMQTLPENDDPTAIVMTGNFCSDELDLRILRRDQILV